VAHARDRAEEINMPYKAFLLKPNLSAIAAAYDLAKTDVVASVSGKTVVLTTGLAGILTEEAGDAGSDWLYVTSGDYNGYHWRITSYVAGTKTITLDILGSVPAAVATCNCEVKSAVSIKCGWTDVTTITYVPLEFEKYAYKPMNELKLTRVANRTSVIINMKKYSGTIALTNCYIGNFDEYGSGGINNEDCIASQIAKGLEYVRDYWPSVSPKYSLVYWYDTNGVQSTKRYHYASAAFRAWRVAKIAYDLEESFNHNLRINSMSFEVL